MDFAAGRNAYVTVQSTDRAFDSWVLVTSCETVDVSDYDRRSAKTLPGLPRASVTLSGPYAVGELGMIEGQEYEVQLGITDTVFVDVTVLVDRISLSQSVRGVARVDVTGVVTSDIENEELGATNTIEDL